MKILRQLSIDLQSLELPRLTRYNPLNPSFVVTKDGLRVVYRGCNYNLRQAGYRYFYGSWASAVTDNQNYSAEVSFDLALRNASFIEDRHLRALDQAVDGIQDLKLFRWNNRLYATGSGCNSFSFLKGEAPTRKFRMMLLEVVSNRLELVTTFSSRQDEEKNWMPWIKNNDLFLVYQPSPFRLLKFDPGTKDVRNANTQAGLDFEPETSGGTPLVPFGDDFIGITHRKIGQGPRAIYSHRIFVMSTSGMVIQMSEPFSFEGANIEYCSGLAFKNDCVFLGYGAHDERAVIIKARTADLWNSLNWVRRDT